MRIPRNIEWRAGVILVAVTAVFLGLLIVLTLTRMDVGLEVEGVMRRTQAGWTLTAEVPGERLSLLRRCRYVRIRVGGEEVWYGRIAGIGGRLMQGGPVVLAEIEVHAMGAVGIQADSSEIVQAMLLEERNAPVLRVFFDSILNEGCA